MQEGRHVDRLENGHRIIQYCTFAAVAKIVVGTEIMLRSHRLSSERLSTRNTDARCPVSSDAASLYPCAKQGQAYTAVVGASEMGDSETVEDKPSHGTARVLASAPYAAKGF